MTVPVVLLPGAGLPAALAFPAVLEALGDEVQALPKDLELFADGEPPLGYALDHEVSALARFADAAALDRFHLVGYSAGGAISLAFAASHPEWLLSLALIEPAWAGNEGLGQSERDLWLKFDRIMSLPVPQRMAEFRRLHMPPGVPPPPPDPGPSPPWMARRPRGLPMLVRAFHDHRLDLDALRALRAPVYLAVGGRSNAAYFAEEATRLASVFPDCEIEVYAERHHFDPPQHAEPDRLAAALRRLWARA